MKVTIDMPMVQRCSVDECAYNHDSCCHAKAITIGDGVHPGCDTFLSGSTGHTRASIMAGVGACKVSDCEYNDDLECSADSIEVAITGDTAECMTCKMH
jgi:hypothetical protein